MITKEQLLASMLREIDICAHLYGKLTPEAMSYQPSPAQRTTIELLRYLAVIGIAACHCLKVGDWKAFGAYSERVREMPLEGFPAAMEQQKREIEEFFNSTTEETLETQEAKLPTGVVLPLGPALMEAPLKWLTAYKLQLFLYAKATGASDIGTTNAWRGSDRRSPPLTGVSDPSRAPA